MKIKKILTDSLDFGTNNARDNIFSFALKILFYIIPAVLFGYYTDRIVVVAKKRKIFGENEIHYIFLQTILIVSTLYLLVSALTAFMSGIQQTIAGSFFVVMYFGMQTNYIVMLKKLLKPTPR